MHTYMTCLDCGGEYSTTPGDYFWMPDGKVFTCDVCGQPMALVREVRAIEVVAEDVTIETLEGEANSVQR